jgi:ORF6N domain
MASLVSKKVIVLKPESVAQLVFFIRGEKVMFDADLAMLYGVEVRSLNQTTHYSARAAAPAQNRFSTLTSDFCLLACSFAPQSESRIPHSAIVAPS